MGKKSEGSEVAMVLHLISAWCDAEAIGGINHEDPRQAARNECLFDVRNLLDRLYRQRTGEYAGDSSDCDRCGGNKLEDWELERLLEQIRTYKPRKKRK